VTTGKAPFVKPPPRLLAPRQIEELHGVDHYGGSGTFATFATLRGNSRVGE